MSHSQDLIRIIKQELKLAKMSYADLAVRLGMAESSVKRMLAKGDMSLTRLDEVCQAMQLDLSDLAARLLDERPMLHELTLEQERTVVGDAKLMLCAICVLSQWSHAQIVAHYRLSQTEVIASLAKLDKMGIIELKPHNRYRLKLSKTFRWRPHGPVMRYFRQHVLHEFFDGSFDGQDESMLLTYGSISRHAAKGFTERLTRLAQDFAQQHQMDQKLPPEDRTGYALLLAQRAWEFSAFEEMRR